MYVDYTVRVHFEAEFDVEGADSFAKEFGETQMRVRGDDEGCDALWAATQACKKLRERYATGFFHITDLKVKRRAVR